MSSLISYFIEFETPDKRVEFMDRCFKQIGWALDILEGQLIQSGRFISFYRDDTEWASKRWVNDDWGLEYIKRPEPLYAASSVDAHDAVIAMAQALVASGVILSNFGWIELKKDDKFGNRVSKQYWFGGWKGCVDPQTRLDIAQQYVVQFDKEITEADDDELEQAS